MLISFSFLHSLERFLGSNGIDPSTASSYLDRINRQQHLLIIDQGFTVRTDILIFSSLILTVFTLGLSSHLGQVYD